MSDDVILTPLSATLYLVVLSLVTSLASRGDESSMYSVTVESRTAVECEGDRSRDYRVGKYYIYQTLYTKCRTYICTALVDTFISCTYIQHLLE